MKDKKELVSLGLTEKKAEEIVLLESKMLEEAVKFQFKKKDGSIRDAVGTLVRGKMVKEDGSVWEPVGPQRKENPSIVNFWDCVKKEWRCFNVFNLIAVEG